MSPQGLFGWDLLFKTIQCDIKNESDIIIAIVHLYLTKNSSLKCLGVGDDKTLSVHDEGSELLPSGWNENQNSYSLRYVFNNELYILLGAVTEELLIINLLNVETKKASNISLNSGETVTNKTGGNIKAIVPDISQVWEKIKTELVDPVFSGNTVEVTTQTSPGSSRRSHNVRPDDPLMIRGPRNSFDARPTIVDPLRDIGRGDLDPLGRGGGGMLFPDPGLPGGPFGGINPFPGPRGGLPPPPPGARFDPFGPPDAVRGNPNPDHFRPPPDFDDMYM